MEDKIHNICDQLRSRGESIAAEFVERLEKRFIDEERKTIILERAYSQQQNAWSKAIARADKYEEALKQIACGYDTCTCSDQSICSYGIARAALEGKDE